MVSRQEGCAFCTAVLGAISASRREALLEWAPEFDPDADEDVLYEAMSALLPILAADRCSLLLPFGKAALRVLASSKRSHAGDLVTDRERHPDLIEALETDRTVVIKLGDIRSSAKPDTESDSGRFGRIAVPLRLRGTPAVLRITSQSDGLDSDEQRALEAAAHLLQHAVERLPDHRINPSPMLSLAVKFADAVLDVAPNGCVERAFGAIKERFSATPTSLEGKALDDLIGERTRGDAVHQLLALLEGQHQPGGSAFQATLPGAPPQTVRLWGVRVPGIPARALIAAKRDSGDERDARALFEDLPIPALVLDSASQRVVGYNSAFRRLCNVEDDSLVGLSLDDFIEMRADETVLAPAPGQSRIVEVRPPIKDAFADQDLVIVLDRQHRSDNQQRLTAMQDALSRQALELADLHQRLDTMGDAQIRFLSASAHELKTPLSVIQSYLETLLEDLSEGLSQEQRTFLETTYSSTLRLRRLVVDIVDLAALESGALSMDISRVSAPPIVGELIDEMKEIARKAEIVLEVGDVGDLPPIRADSARLAQVMRNLLDNAIKYTPAGGRIWFHGDSDTDTVTLSVSDTGAGIPTEELGTVFEQFVRGGARADRKRPEGSGLGLAICRKIVGGLGGNIWVSSIEGQGSTFSVNLPRWPDDSTTDGGDTPRKNSA